MLANRGQNPAPVGQGPAGTSPSDQLTVWRQLTQAVNNLAETLVNITGAQNFPEISVTTLVKTGVGRCCLVSVTTAGTTEGQVFDTSLVTSTANLVSLIPQDVGVYVLNIPVALGIVINPGEGQVVTVSYS